MTNGEERGLRLEVADVKTNNCWRSGKSQRGGERKASRWKPGRLIWVARLWRGRRPPSDRRLDIMHGLNLIYIIFSSLR